MNEQYQKVAYIGLRRKDGSYAVNIPLYVKLDEVDNLDESQGFSFYDKNVKMPYVIQNRQYYGLKDFRLVMRI